MLGLCSSATGGLKGRQPGSVGLAQKANHLALAGLSCSTSRRQHGVPHDLMLHPQPVSLVGEWMDGWSQVCFSCMEVLSVRACCLSCSDSAVQGGVSLQAQAGSACAALIPNVHCFMSL